MKTVNIHKAKTHLSELIRDVLKGEEVIISRYDKPLVRLEPYQLSSKRTPGVWKSEIQIEDDFDELPENIIDAFRGKKE